MVQRKKGSRDGDIRGVYRRNDLGLRCLLGDDAEEKES